MSLRQGIRGQVLPDQGDCFHRPDCLQQQQVWVPDSTEQSMRVISWSIVVSSLCADEFLVFRNIPKRAVREVSNLLILLPTPIVSSQLSYLGQWISYSNFVFVGGVSRLESVSIVSKKLSFGTIFFHFRCDGLLSMGLTSFLHTCVGRHVLLFTLITLINFYSCIFFQRKAGKVSQSLRESLFPLVVERGGSASSLRSPLQLYSCSWTLLD